MLGDCLLTNYTIENKAKAVQDWAIYKKDPIIKAGLKEAGSKLQTYQFDILRSLTNAVEQFRQKSKATGRNYLTLAGAIRA